MILALDIGRHVGWARSDRRLGVLDLNSYSDDADAYIALSRWLSDQLSEHLPKPELVLIERPFFTTRIRDADFTTGLVRLAHMVARMHDVPRRELSALTVRKAMFGRARGTSDTYRMINIRAAGWPAVSNHDADAVALLLAHQFIHQPVAGRSSARSVSAQFL